MVSSTEKPHMNVNCMTIKLKTRGIGSLCQQWPGLESSCEN